MPDPGRRVPRTGPPERTTVDRQLARRTEDAIRETPRRRGAHHGLAGLDDTRTQRRLRHVHFPETVVSAAKAYPRYGDVRPAGKPPWEAGPGGPASAVTCPAPGPSAGRACALR